jgi:hypothetical protein
MGPWLYTRVPLLCYQPTYAASVELFLLQDINRNQQVSHMTFTSRTLHEYYFLYQYYISYSSQVKLFYSVLLYVKCVSLLHIGFIFSEEFTVLNCVEWK